jgi:hypothetical protein
MSSKLHVFAALSSRKAVSCLLVPELHIAHLDTPEMSKTAPMPAAIQEKHRQFGLNVTELYTPNLQG